MKTGSVCGDDRFEVIERAKEHILGVTNIAGSKDEMSCLDSFLFRCWQMGWLKQYEQIVQPAADTKRNALAELAERIKRGRHISTGIAWFDVDKAQRIVAELAKVKVNSLGGPWSEKEAYEAISKCRAIAEEGVNDGQ